MVLHGALGSSDRLGLVGNDILQAGQVDLFELHVDPELLGPLLRITLGLTPEVSPAPSDSLSGWDCNIPHCAGCSLLTQT